VPPAAPGCPRSWKQQERGTLTRHCHDRLPSVPSRTPSLPSLTGRPPPSSQRAELPQLPLHPCVYLSWRNLQPEQLARAFFLINPPFYPQMPLPTATAVPTPSSPGRSPRSETRRGEGAASPTPCGQAAGEPWHTALARWPLT